MDKTTYHNHYYFISLVSFLLIFLPANAYFSVDAYRNEKKRFQKVPAWSVNVLKLLLFIVYFYAGLAKLNSDWLIEAMPLKIWLPSKFLLSVTSGIEALTSSSAGDKGNPEHPDNDDRSEAILVCPLIFPLICPFVCPLVRPFSSS